MSRFAVIISFAAWLMFILCGMARLAAYENTPGAAKRAPRTLSASDGRALQHGTQSLIAFIHPRCPCSRATLFQLERVMSALPSASGCNVKILFFTPVGARADWASGCLMEEARRIHGAVIAVDRGGSEARRFGAMTSGQICAYGRDGSLVFSGGITAGRGSTETGGSSRILEAILSGRDRGIARPPVFGCALIGD